MISYSEEEVGSDLSITLIAYFGLKFHVSINSKKKTSKRWDDRGVFDIWIALLISTKIMCCCFFL